MKISKNAPPYSKLSGINPAHGKGRIFLLSTNMTKQLIPWNPFGFFLVNIEVPSIMDKHALFLMLKYFHFIFGMRYDDSIKIGLIFCISSLKIFCDIGRDHKRD